MTHSSTPATRMLPTTASLGNQSDRRWTEQSTYRGRPSHPRMKDFPTDIVSLLLWCNPAAPLGGTWKLVQSCQFDLFHWISETETQSNSLSSRLDGVRLGRGERACGVASSQWVCGSNRHVYSVAVKQSIKTLSYHGLHSKKLS